MTLADLMQWFDRRPQRRIGIRVFQIAIALAIVIRCLTEMPYAEWLFGPNGVGKGSTSHIAGPFAPLLDWFFGSHLRVLALFGVQLGGALMLLVGKSTRIATMTLLITFFTFESRLPTITDGGDNLIRLSLIYMTMLLPARASAPAGSLRTWVHNLGVVLLTAQVLILYFTAGMMKAQGTMWAHGTALYMVSQVEWISLPGMREMFKYAAFSVPATYVTVAWQVSFPIAVFSRFKLAFLMIGLFFHLGIGVFMGLVTFSSVMIGAEAFLLDDDDYSRIVRRARSFAAVVRARFNPAVPSAARCEA